MPELNTAALNVSQPRAAVSRARETAEPASSALSTASGTDGAGDASFSQAMAQAATRTQTERQEARDAAAARNDQTAAPRAPKEARRGQTASDAVEKTSPATDDADDADDADEMDDAGETEGADSKAPIAASPLPPAFVQAAAQSQAPTALQAAFQRHGGKTDAGGPATVADPAHARARPESLASSDVVSESVDAAHPSGVPPVTAQQQANSLTSAAAPEFGQALRGAAASSATEHAGTATRTKGPSAEAGGPAVDAATPLPEPRLVATALASRGRDESDERTTRPGELRATRPTVDSKTGQTAVGRDVTPTWLAPVNANAAPRDRLVEDFQQRFERALSLATQLAPPSKAESASPAALVTLSTVAPSSAGVSPVQVPVLTPVYSSGFAEDFANRVMFLARGRVQGAELSLSPADLGPVKVLIEVRGHEASIVFGATHADTRAAIEAALPHLREMLGSQGLQLADARVDTQAGQSSPQDFGRSQQGQTGGRHRNEPGNTGAEALGAPSTPVPASTTATASGRPPRLIDVVA